MDRPTRAPPLTSARDSPVSTRSLSFPLTKSSSIHFGFSFTQQARGAPLLLTCLPGGTLAAAPHMLGSGTFWPLLLLLLHSSAHPATAPVVAPQQCPSPAMRHQHPNHCPSSLTGTHRASQDLCGGGRTAMAAQAASRSPPSTLSLTASHARPRGATVDTRLVQLGIRLLLSTLTPFFSFVSGNELGIPVSSSFFLLKTSVFVVLVPFVLVVQYFFMRCFLGFRRAHVFLLQPWSVCFTVVQFFVSVCSCCLFQ